MESRPQHDGLAGHHRIPADAQQEDTGPARRSCQNVEVLEDKAEAIWYDAHRRDNQAPEVESSELAEGAKDEDEQFDDIVHGQSEEEGNADLQSQRVAFIASTDAPSGRCWIAGGRSDIAMIP